MAYIYDTHKIYLKRKITSQENKNEKEEKNKKKK